ncbi:MAG: hypothetical protein OXN44_09155 [Acidimicrobiaceae bacterium]|nr:hypothetical protein [Acidimicrobiaceae bacterium]MDE0608134.1 hypothetical protein [Acidimicrobiaceae bacterium]
MIQPARFPTPETPDPMNLDHELLDEASGPEQVLGRPQAKSSWMRGLPESPLPAILGAVIVLLLGFALTQTNDRISRLEDRVDAGFTRVDERFARIDERFVALEARFDQLDLKLTALIAALNATEQVEAALEGRLLTPEAPSVDEIVPQPG